MAARRASRSLPVNTMRSRLLRVDFLLREEVVRFEVAIVRSKVGSESTVNAVRCKGAGPFRPTCTLEPKKYPRGSTLAPYLVEKSTIFALFGLLMRKGP